jgi:hypothetical protein
MLYKIEFLYLAPLILLNYINGAVSEKARVSILLQCISDITILPRNCRKTLTKLVENAIAEWWCTSNFCVYIDIIKHNIIGLACITVTAKIVQKGPTYLVIYVDSQQSAASEYGKLTSKWPDLCITYTKIE